MGKKSILQFPDRGYSSSIILGTAATGQPVQVTQDELCSGCYILGIQGQGKTSLLEHIIYQQMDRDEAIIVFDIKGDLISNIISRMPANKVSKTYLLDLTDRDYPFSFNLFACSHPEDEESQDATRNQVLHGFEKLWPDVRSGRFFKEVLRHMIITLIENPELTMMNIPDLLEDADYREPFIRRIKNVQTQRFWRRYNALAPGKQRDYKDPLLGRLDELLTESVVSHIISQPNSLINFRKAIDNREIILIKLPVRNRAYETSAPIIGTLLMSAIYAATFSYMDTPEKDRPGFTLVVDEFQHFATDEYASLFEEGRAFGIKQFLAHQHRAQFLRGEGMTVNIHATMTAHTVIAMKTTPEDAKDPKGVASKFEGLKRRPTDIYIDVLDRLKTHRNPLVKEFYLHTVTSLQTASKMKIGTTEDRYGRKINVLPQFDFGFGVVSFNPEHVVSVLKELNNLFYYSQKEASIDLALREKFIRAFGELNGISRYRNTEGMEWSDFFLELMNKFGSMGLEDRIRHLEDEIRKIENQLLSIIPKILEITDLPIIIDYLKIDRITYLLYLRHRDNLQELIKEILYLKEKVERDKKKMPELKRLGIMYLLEPELKVWPEFEQAVNKAYMIFKLEVEPLQKRKDDMIKLLEQERKYLELNRKITMPLDFVINALIKDPIASDKPPEIDEILINLKQRHALVNKGGAIYEMETIDLNNGKREEEEKKRLKQAYDSRIGSIRERTRSTYCRSRKIVEQQIYHLPDTKVTPQDDTIEIEDEEETKRLQQKYRELLNKPPTSQENTRKEKPEDKRKNTDDNVDWKPYDED